MTQYTVAADGLSNLRSSAYPGKHYGGAYAGGSEMTFCEDGDLASPDANVLGMAGMPVSMLLTSPLSVTNKFFGMHILDRANDAMTGVTVGTVRSHDLKNGKSRWSFIQTTSSADTSTWDWTDMDSWVNTHYSAGRDMIFVLFSTPSFFAQRPTEEGAYGPSNLGAQSEPSSTYMAKWSAYCTAVATRYLGKIKYYEIWNEPNYNNDGVDRGSGYCVTPTGTSSKTFFFSGTQSKLAEMTRLANQAIKAVDATAKIISPATTAWVPSAGGTAETYFSGMLAASDGASGTMLNWVDIIGVHLYETPQIWGSALAGMIDRIDSAKATLGISAMETWDTESAPWTTSTLATLQSQQFIGRSLVTLAAKGVKRTCYYMLDSATMGLKQYPALAAYWETIAALLKSSTIQSVARLKGGQLVCGTSNGLVVI